MMVEGTESRHCRDGRRDGERNALVVSAARLKASKAAFNASRTGVAFAA
jgi:hypothetical protein